MKSFFSMSFQNSFHGDVVRGFRPAMGQIITDIEQSPLTDWTPNQTTSEAPTTRPPNTSDTDWAKILAEGLKDAASGYGIYTQAQIQKMKAEADILKAKNPSVAPLLPSTSNSMATIALVAGGVAVLGLILVVAVK